MDPDEHDFGRLYTMKNSAWGHEDFDWNIVSVCFSLHAPGLYVLSQQGDVCFYRGGVKNGTFLKITPQGIENHSIEIADHFWGLTSFQGKVYLATLKGLYVFDGKTLVGLDTGREPHSEKRDACG